MTPTNPTGCRTIAVVSGKGGVGRTSIAVNLAVMLAVLKRRVALVDPCGRPSDAELLLNFNPTYGDPCLQLFCAQFRVECAPQFDFMIHDCPAGASSVALRIAASADVILVVNTPDPASITDAYIIVKRLVARNDHRNVWHIANRVCGRDEAGETFRRIARVAASFLNFSLADAGFVVQDTLVEAAVRNRRPFVVADPRGPASLCIAALAARLARAEPALGVTPRGRLLHRVAAMFA